MDKPLRCRPLEGRRDQKSPIRRCFKLRPPWRAGFAGFASGCRSLFGTRFLVEPGSLPRGFPPPESEPSSLATVRPLVRMSTDQHAATGTCECWARVRYGRFPEITRGFGQFPQPIAAIHSFAACGLEARVVRSEKRERLHPRGRFRPEGLGREAASSKDRGEREVRPARSQLSGLRDGTGTGRDGIRGWPLARAAPDLPRGALDPWPRASAPVSTIAGRGLRLEVRPHGPGPFETGTGEAAAMMPGARPSHRARTGRRRTPRHPPWRKAGLSAASAESTPAKTHSWPPPDIRKPLRVSDHRPMPPRFERLRKRPSRAGRRITSTEQERCQGLFSRIFVSAASRPLGF
jgi:hypothetical protein